MSRLDDIKARVAAATEEPWEYFPDGRTVCGGPTLEYIAEMFGAMGHPTHQADARFIAHARADVPWLVQRVERLERAGYIVAMLALQGAQYPAGADFREAVDKLLALTRQAALAEDA